jgi:hypothetical protein
MTIIDELVDSSMIAHFATRKNTMTDEKARKILHAFQVNKAIESGSLLPVDPVCLYRGCLHHYSLHNKSWRDPNTGKRRRCRCKHAFAVNWVAKRDVKLNS